MEKLFIITLLFVSSLSVPLPKWVHRVKSCPEQYNTSAWMEASKQLNCLYDLTSKHPAEQGMIYHCLASTYLNESVEFCGRSVPIAPGNCPIYNYKFSSNVAPSYYNCSKFSSGCPDKMFHSKEVYKYPECLNINPKKKCFKADVHCKNETKNIYVSSTASQARYTTPKDTIFTDANHNEKAERKEPERDMVWMLPVGILVGVLITGIILAVVIFTQRRQLMKYLRKLGTKEVHTVELEETQMKLLTKQTTSNNEETDNNREACETENTTSKGSDSPIGTLDTDSEKNEDNCDPKTLQEESCENGRCSNKVKERHGKRRPNKKPCKVKVENEENKSGKTIKGLDLFTRLSCNKGFSDFLQDISEDMSAETTRKMKEHLKDRMGDPDPDLEKVKTPKELLEYMDNNFSLYNNVAILQALALSIQPPMKMCTKSAYSTQRAETMTCFTLKEKSSLN